MTLASALAMPNPSGKNATGTPANVFAREPPYGAKKQMDALERSSKLAGAQGSASALNAPRRAQRQAVRGRGRPSAAPPGEAGTEPVQPLAVPQETNGGPVGALPYEVRLAAAWQEIASHPDASELAREMAGRALAAIRSV